MSHAPVWDSLSKKEPKIKGWCPSAYHPMMSRDGLIVRVKPRLAALNPEQLEVLAELATSYGAGVIELTTRANVQLRGLAKGEHHLILSQLAKAGLLEASSDDETRHNIVFSPYGSAKSDLFSQKLYHRLTHILKNDTFKILPQKFGFLIDISGACFVAGSTTKAALAKRLLADISGDIRIETSQTGTIIIRADTMPVGKEVKTLSQAIAIITDLLRWFIDTGGIGPDGRGRMKSHIASGKLPPEHLGGNTPPARAQHSPSPGPFHISKNATISGFHIAAAFGQFSASSFIYLAQIARNIKQTLRITPFRMVYFSTPNEADRTTLQNTILPKHKPHHCDLIISPQNALSHIYACVGAPYCLQTSLETRNLAHKAGQILNAKKSHNAPKKIMHISGCAKGCAYSKAASNTFVGNGDKFDLVINGAAWETPIKKHLTTDEILKLIQEDDVL